MKLIDSFTKNTFLISLLSFITIHWAHGANTLTRSNIYCVLQDDTAYAREKRDLVRRIETLKDHVDAQLTQLRAESGNVKKDAEKDYEASINRLQKMSKKLEDELEQAKNSTSSQWKEFLNNMNRNADEIEREWKQAQKKIKKSVRADKNKKQV